MFIVLFLAIVLYVAHRYFDLRNLSNPFVSYFIYYCAFVFGGLIAYNLVYSDTYKISTLSIVLVFYGLISTLLMGIFLDKSIFKGRYIKRTRLSIQPSQYRLENYIFFFFGFFLFIYFLNQSGFNPLEATDQGLERVTKQAGFGYVKTLSLTLTFLSAPPLLFNRKVSIFSKLIIFLVSSAIFLGFGYRSLFLEYLLTIFMIFYFTRKTEIKFSSFIMFAVLLYFLLVVLGALRSGVNSDIFSIVNARLFWRPFVTLRNMNSIIEVYGSGNQDLLWGKSMLYDLSTLIPGSYGVGSSLSYYNVVTNTMRYGGTITPTIIAILFSNFGLYGVLIIMPLIPFFLMFLAHKWYVRPLVSIDTLNMYLFISLALWNIAISGFVLPFLYQIIPFLILTLIRISLRKAISNMPKLKIQGR